MPDNIFDELVRRNPPPSSAPIESGNVFEGLLANNPPPITTPTPGFGGSIVSSLSPILEFISRPQFASAAFFDGLADESKSIFDAISDSFGELVDPKRKLSFSDVIKRRAPEFAKNNPKATAVLGFALDVGLDPTSYLGIGFAGKGVKIGTQVLTKYGTTLRAGMIANEIASARSVISAIGKNVQRDALRATQRGISATVQDLSPFRIGKEVIALSKQYADELTQLGIPFDKQSIRKLAFDELGINEIPLPKTLGTRPLRAKKVAGMVNSIVDDISSELKQAVKIGKDLPPPLPLVAGAEVPGAAKAVRTPVFGTRSPLPKTRKGQDVTRKSQIPERGFESSTGIVEQRFPDLEEVQLFAKSKVLSSLSKFKPGKNASKEQIDNLNALVGQTVNSYVETATNLVRNGQSISKFTKEFKSSLLNRLQKETTDKTIERLPKTKFAKDFEEELPFEAGMDEALLTPVKTGGISVKGALAARPQTVMPQGVIRKLTIDEVYEHVEKRIQRIANFDPALAKKIFKEPKTTLQLSVPFTKARADILNLTALAPLKRSIDFVTKLNDAVIGSNIPVISQTAKFAKTAGEFTGTTLTGLKETAKGLFVRPLDGPFGTVIKEFQNQYDYIEGQVIRETKKLFDTISKNPQARERITNLMREVDDRTRKIEFIEDRTITQAEADKIFYEAMEKARISKGGKFKDRDPYGLTKEEVSIIAGLKQEYANIASLEIESSLLKTEIKNYHPRYYDALEDGKDMIAVSKYKYGLSTQLTSSQRRKYLTMAEAESAGLIPEMDAALIYATRVSSSRRALAKKQFFESLSEALGVQIKNQNDLPKLLGLKEGKRYLNDIKLLGESVYPTGMNTNVQNLVKAIDHMNAFFRKGATIAKPSFAPKQLISNAAQAMLELGPKAANTFNPMVLVDAAGLLFDFYRGKSLTQVPKAVNNYFAKHLGGNAALASRMVLSNIVGEQQLLDFAKDFKRITVNGTEWTGTDLVRVMQELNVVRGVDAVGNTFKKNLEQALKFDPDNAKQVTLELGKYWKHPSMVEDYSRATQFINFITQGYSPKQATDKVNEVLFDYQHGLAFFERKFVRRILPFYTFPRFAIPFVLQKTMEVPGRTAMFNKAIGLMEKLLVSSEDTLNPSEREVFGDSFYVEQPRLFTGFDKDGAAKFNILNNMTPLDALSLLVYDTKTNKLDVKRTAEKTILAALTPYLKVPIEVAFDKNFFTEQVVSEGQKFGNLSRIPLPEWVKDAIGWEDRTNLRTGKTSTYINSYFGYFMTSVIPALRQFINFGDVDRSLLDKSMEIVTGVVPRGIDLKETRQWQALSDRKQVREFVGKIRTARLKGADTLFEQYMSEYKEYLEVIKQGNAAKNQNEIRGLGIGGQRTQQLEQEQR
jgi:hypothetical protein